MRVSKWGNSLAIRLPAAVVEGLNLKVGDEINIHVAGDKDFVVEREMTREEAIELLHSSGMRLPPGFKFNREEANAR
jgi:antitoxin MazE